MKVDEVNKYGEILDELDGLNDELKLLIKQSNIASSILNGVSNDAPYKEKTIKSLDKLEILKEKICTKIQLLVEEYEALDAKIEGLNNPLDRQIIRLRHINRYSFEQIGDTLFYSGGTIKNRYYSILRSI